MTRFWCTQGSMRRAPRHTPGLNLPLEGDMTRDAPLRSVELLAAKLDTIYGYLGQPVAIELKIVVGSAQALLVCGQSRLR